MAGLLGSAAMAQELGDAHLDFVARTTAESERIEAVAAETGNFTVADPFEGLPAGAATLHPHNNADAFSEPSANMDLERQLDFRVGNDLFRKIWVSAPSSTLASEGPGPPYNARGSQSSHIRYGRGHPPEGPGDNAVSMFLRISIPADQDAAIAEIPGYIATAPDPVYGNRLQEFGTMGIRRNTDLPRVTLKSKLPFQMNRLQSCDSPLGRPLNWAMGRCIRT